MANFNLVIDSKFKPFSYEEMIAPLIASTQAHQAIEDQYSDLGTKASVWDKLKDSEIDRITYNRYKAYADELEAQADILASQGLNPTSRRNALLMKKRYGSEIAPIEEAYARRAKQMEEQNKGRAAGIVYNTLAQDTSLEDYIHNDTLQHQFADSNAGYKRVHDAASALKNELQDFKANGRIDAFTKVLMQRNGYTRETANQAINDINAALRGEENLRGRGILQDILATEMETSGVSSWGNRAAQMDYLNRISPAIYNAVGTTTYKPYADKAAELAAKKAMDTPQGPSDLGINAIPYRIFNSKEQKAASDIIKKYSKYFYTTYENGKKVARLTNEGRKEYFRKVKLAKSTGSGSGTAMLLNAETNMNTSGYSEFRKFMDSLGANKYVNSKDETLQPGNFGNTWSQYIKDHDTSLVDTTVDTEFGVPILGESLNTLKEAIKSNMGDKLYIVDYDKDSKKYVRTKDFLTKDQIGDATYIEAIDAGSHGKTYKINTKDEDGKAQTYRVESLRSLHNVYSNDRDRLSQTAESLRDHINNGEVPITDAYGNITFRKGTPEELVEANNIYKKLRSKSAYMAAQIGTQGVKVKPQEIKPVGVRYD